jgi:MHS family shikimate/dehydroshikimate transporter-like MFS transporter
MSAPAPVPESSVSRVVLASFLGTMIEWYDFFLYGTASALVFNKLFFTDLDPRTGTIAAFATNAVGFFARPLGGVVFGHYGDRVGRKSMLVTTLVIMGVATCLIGLLPTYNTIGIAAPVLLVLLRFAQGFGVGGEWGGAVLMAVEHGHQGRRGLYASWVQAGVAAGMILASGVFGLFSLLPEDQFLAWGWRVPFLLGVVLLGIGLFIRVRVMETPLFAAHLAAEKPQTMPILEVLRDYPRNVLLAMGARCGENASFYIITVFVLTYATATLPSGTLTEAEISALKLAKRSLILRAVLIGSVFQFIAIPLLGWLSDLWGRRKVYLMGTVLMAAFAWPFFRLVDTQSPLWIHVAVAVGLVIHAAMYAPQAAFFAELFGTRVRYSGASFGYQLASPLAGGLAPLIASALLKWSDNDPWPIAAYVIGMCAITWVSVYLAEETHAKEMGPGE